MVNHQPSDILLFSSINALTENWFLNNRIEKGQELERFPQKKSSHCKQPLKKCYNNEKGAGKTHKQT